MKRLLVIITLCLAMGGCGRLKHSTPYTLKHYPVKGMDVQVICSHQQETIPDDTKANSGIIQCSSTASLYLWGKIEDGLLKTSIATKCGKFDNIDFIQLERITGGKVVRYGWVDPCEPIMLDEEPWLVGYEMRRY